MPPTIPDQLYGSPIVTTQTPDYSLYAPGMKGHYAMTPPGDPEIMAFLADHRGDIESIASGILSVTGQIRESLSDLGIKTAQAQETAYWYRAAAKNEVYRALNMQWREADELQRATQQFLEQFPQEERAMYKLAYGIKPDNKAAIEEQMAKQMSSLVEDLNRSEQADQALTKALDKAKATKKGNIKLDRVGYAISLGEILYQYYTAVTEATEEARSAFVESVLSFAINLALATVGGILGGAAAGAVGGIGGVILGAVICGIFAFLDFIVVAATEKSIARHFMDLCEFVSYWGDYAASKAAEKIAPALKPTLMDMVRWKIGEFMDIIPIRF